MRIICYISRLMHVGQFFNGLGGPVAMAAPPILSAVWFPAKERTTATAIGTVFNYMGVAVTFVMGLKYLYFLNLNSPLCFYDFY